MAWREGLTGLKYCDSCDHWPCICGQPSILSVPCSFCRAEPGTACQNRHRDTVDYDHKARQRLAWGFNAKARD